MVTPATTEETVAQDAECGCQGPKGGCEITELFELLSRAHMMDVLHLFMCEHPDPLRFKHLQAEMDISPNTLSERLKDLVTAGLVEREAFQEIPPRVEYRATRMAMELRPAFDGLGSWADRHALMVR